MARRTSAALATAVVFALTLLVVPATAQAAPAGPGRLRSAHLSPDAGALDVYLDRARILPGLAYRTVSRYQSVTPGVHTVEVRRAGASAGSAALVSTAVTIEPGGTYTVAALDVLASLRLLTVPDDLSAPPPGKTKVRNLTAVPGSPAVDVGVPGQPGLFTNVQPLSATPFVVLDAGTYQTEVRLAGTDTVILTEGAKTLPAGAIITFIAVPTPNGAFEVLTVLDAAGARVAPRGGVATGAGGSAPEPHGGYLAACIGLALLTAPLTLAAERVRAAARPGRRKLAGSARPSSFAHFSVIGPILPRRAARSRLSLAPEWTWVGTAVAAGTGAWAAPEAAERRTWTLGPG